MKELKNHIYKYLSTEDKYVKDFVKEATPEQMVYFDIALKLLANNNAMGVIFDYTDDMHLQLITNKLVEYKDTEFVKKLVSVNYAEELVALKDLVPDPDDEIFMNYVIFVIEHFEEELGKSF